MDKSKKEERNRLLKKRIRLGLLRSYRNLETFLANEKASEERGIISALIEWRDTYIEAAQVALSLTEEGEMRHLLEMSVHSNRVSLNILASVYLTTVDREECDDLGGWTETQFILAKKNELRRALDALDKGGSGTKAANDLVRIVGRYTPEYIRELLISDLCKDDD